MGNNEDMDIGIFEKRKRALGDIVDLINEFCREHLNAEYLDLCEEMVADLYEFEIPIHRGRPASWASGIVHTIGFVNFLQDPSQSPHMTSPEIAKGFDVSQGTMQAKSKIIRDELDLTPFDPRWCLTALLADNPLVWTLEIDGMAVDLRTVPREVQEEAYRRGLIPYIPADRDQPEPQPKSGPKIIQFPSGSGGPTSPKSSGKAKEQSSTLFDGLSE